MGSAITTCALKTPATRREIVSRSEVASGDRGHHLSADRERRALPRCQARGHLIAPDTHYGYGVPVGCVILTDADAGAVAMGPVGYDIGRGMVSAKSNVFVDAATPEKRLAFNAAVMKLVDMGAGGKSIKLGTVNRSEFDNLIHGGAEYYVEKYGASFDRSRTERHRMPACLLLITVFH